MRWFATTHSSIRPLSSVSHKNSMPDFGMADVPVHVLNMWKIYGSVK